MKKNVLCVFFMIFLILVTCTILSAKIEEEMTLEVVGWTVRCDYVDTIVPSAMLFYDENGEHAYEVFEGTGWNSGLRAREVVLNGGSFIADRDYMIVRGSSRQPVYGELAQLYDGTDTAPSTYLTVYPGGIPKENEMLFQAQILESSEHVLLLYMEQGTQPFTQNRAKGAMVQLAAPSWEVFSLDALTQLLESIPMTAAAFVILFALAVFGILFSILIRNAERQPALLICNGILIAGLLIALVLVLRQIDYPASILPAENIFHIAHYRSECGEIFSALRELDSETTQYFTNLHAAVMKESASILIGGSLAVLLGATGAIFASLRIQRYLRRQSSVRRTQYGTVQ